MIYITGDGDRINDSDFIAIICYDYKKVYGFNNVKHRPNYPKEL